MNCKTCSNLLFILILLFPLIIKLLNPNLSLVLLYIWLWLPALIIIAIICLTIYSIFGYFFWYLLFHLFTKGPKQFERYLAKASAQNMKDSFFN